MRQILTVLIILIASGVIAFNNSAGMRETLRGWRASGDEAERLEAYAQGKALFAGNWKENGAPILEAWGDDRNEDAQDVAGTIWLARGHYTTGSSTVGTPWCILFTLGNGTPLICESGPNANAAIFLITTGHYQEAIKRYPGSGAAAVVTATPPPGDWMWHTHTLLDEPPKRAGGS